MIDKEETMTDKEETDNNNYTSRLKEALEELKSSISLNDSKSLDIVNTIHDAVDEIIDKKDSTEKDKEESEVPNNVEEKEDNTEEKPVNYLLYKKALHTLASSNSSNTQLLAAIDTLKLVDDNNNSKVIQDIRKLYKELPKGVGRKKLFNKDLELLSFSSPSEMFADDIDFAKNNYDISLRSDFIFSRKGEFSRECVKSFANSSNTAKSFRELDEDFYFDLFKRMYGKSADGKAIDKNVLGEKIFTNIEHQLCEAYRASLESKRRMFLLNKMLDSTYKLIDDNLHNVLIEEALEDDKKD